MVLRSPALAGGFFTTSTTCVSRTVSPYSKEGDVEGPSLQLGDLRQVLQVSRPWLLPPCEGFHFDSPSHRVGNQQDNVLEVTGLGALVWPWAPPEGPRGFGCYLPQAPEWRSSFTRSWTGRCPRGSPTASCWRSTWPRRPVSWGPPPPTVSRPCGPGRGLWPDLPASLLSFLSLVLYLHM